MVDKEEPTTQDNFEENYVEEDDDNYFTTVKANTKTDPQLTKPKRKPIREITLTDEIPALPPKHELLDKPNDSSYEKQEKELNAKIEFHKQSIKKLRDKIHEEKMGVKTPEQKKALEERQVLQNELNDIKLKIESSTQKVATVRSNLADLKNEKESLSRDIDVYTLEALNNEIKKIQDKLGYGQLSITEEKSMIDKKRRLEGQKDKVR
jgi:chromosome segregation ATPase